MAKVLVIPDLHCPFQHQDALAFLKHVKGKHRPDVVVNLGDEVDFHAISNYDTDPDGRSPGDELEAAIDALKPFYKLFPKALVCTSNHTARPFKRAYKASLPARLIKGYREILEAPPGWKWADHHEVDGVRYEHGEGQSGKEGALKAAMAYMQSTVIGHLHSWAGILYYTSPTKSIFGLNSGCLIDEAAYAFAYGKHQKAKPVLGVSIVNNGIPVFIPMRLNKQGRWVGKE